MKLTEKDMLARLKKAEESTRILLSDIPFIEQLASKAEAKFDERRADLLFNVRISGKPANFIVEVKSQASRE